MNRDWFNSKLISGILVAICFGVALYLRVALPWDKVFVGDWIKFTGVDAYYFMRIVDNLVHNFPHLMTFDPYYIYPSGGAVNNIQFWPYLISGVTWLIGLGSPSQHTVDMIGVYLPAVLGALTTVPVYFIGKNLFNRWAGVIAAGLIAILPGEFLGRSQLGYADYHIAEVFFTTLTMLFLILAVKAGREKQFTLDSLWHGQWSTFLMPLVYSLVAGVFLGIYFLTWPGALLFVFIIFVFLVIQFIIDHLRHKPTEYLGFISTITFVASLLILLSVSRDRLVLASFAIAIIIPIAMTMLSYFMAKSNIKPIIYPATIIGLGLVSLIFFYIGFPSIYQQTMGSLSIFGWPIGTTVLEMQPLLLPNGRFSWAVAWGNFTTSFFLSFIALGIVIYLIIKQGEAEKTLFVIWSLIMLAANLAMRRFAYYYVINIAILSGYVSWIILQLTGFKKPSVAPPNIATATNQRVKPKRRNETHSGRRILMAFGVIVVFFIVLFPNIGKAIDTANAVPFAPSDAWMESLTWLQSNTSDPFDNPDFYYELYESPQPGKSYEYPKTAYGVTTWWDYGYWITRIGRRIPTSNPGTGANGEQFFFTAQDETSANKILDQWGSRYVIIDHDITAANIGKFHALATLSDSSPNSFYGFYYQPKDNTLQMVLLFYPEYYRSLVVHLYNFEGRTVIERGPVVISYEDKTTTDGQHYRQITSAQSFDSYTEAQNFVNSQKSDKYRIVSGNPYASPVPLPALEHYKLIYSSKSSVMETGIGMVPEVKIFEYTK